MEVLHEAFSYPWAIRALWAALLVGATCGALGCFIVLRNMSLIGDALSHSILPGIVLSFMLLGYSSIGFFSGAVLAGLITAFAIIWIQRTFSTRADAAVGIVFTTMFALGVIGISLISGERGVHLDLKDFLFGNVLGVSDADLLLTASVSVFTLASVLVFYRHLFITSFQPVVADTMGISSSAVQYYLMFLLALTVVSALQMVGVILVVSMLITPAATALMLSSNLKRVIFLAAAIGMAAGVTGLISAILLEIAPGPAMTVTAACFYLLAGIFSPQKGVLMKWRRKAAHRKKIEGEDFLKGLYKQLEKGPVNIADLKTGPFRPQRLQLILQDLERRKLVEKTGNEIRLTDRGTAAARHLVRAHRLWETYLVNEIGLNEEQIHEEAEKLEHLLPEELLDEVEKTLGYPEKDPHGSPIPLRPSTPLRAISHLGAGEQARIHGDQINEHITAELWSRDLRSGDMIVVVTSDEQSFTIRCGDREYLLPVRLARMIRIH